MNDVNNIDIQKENLRVRQEVEELKTLVKYYEEQMVLSKHKKYGVSNEKTSTAQQQLLHFDETKNETNHCKPKSAVEQITYTRRKREGKRESDLSGLPVEIVGHLVPGEGGVCPKCGVSTRIMGNDSRRELNIETLGRDLDSKKQNVISQICYDMISGNFDSEKYLDYSNILDALKDQHFCVIFVLWNNYHQSVLNLQMPELMEHSSCLCGIRSNTRDYDVFLSLGQDKKVICMRDDNPTVLENDSVKVIRSIETTLGEKFAQRFSIGVGKIHKGFQKLPHSYFESVYALSLLYPEGGKKTSYFVESQNPATLNGNYSVISQAKHYIQNNYAKFNLSLADVASHVHLHPAYFSALFSKSENMSFIDYLTGYRLEKAKHLLQNTDFKLTKIALKVGYQNPTYFSTLFKKHLGMSPSSFRHKC